MELERSEKPLVGTGDGPLEWHGEFGMEVPTFTEPGFSKTGCATLQFHVPISCRGYYRPVDLNDYTGDPADYDIDDKGFVKCDDITARGNPCPHRAVNMQMTCQMHGSALHPQDKVVAQDKRGKVPSRTDMLVSGDLDPAELLQEELVRGYCVGPNGQFGRAPKKIPRILHDKLRQELFRRADDHMERGILDMAKVMIEIANGTAYEPADRIKAAQWVYERVRGKNPERLIVEQKAPWEIALGGIVGGSRAESRLARGLDPETGEPIQDAEWFEDGHSGDDDTGDFSGESARAGGVHLPEQDQLELFEDTNVEDADIAVAFVAGGSGDTSFDDVGHIKPTVDPEEQRELIERARNKRYAARSKGMETIENIPIEFKEIDLGDGTFRLKWELPENSKLPKGMLLREARKRKSERD